MKFLRKYVFVISLIFEEKIGASSYACKLLFKTSLSLSYNISAL